MRRLGSAVVAACMALSGLAMQALPGTAAAAGGTTLADSNIRLVTMIALNGRPEFVSAAAWVALGSRDRERAAQEFIQTGYAEARRAAAEDAANYRAFVETVRDSYDPRESPEVHATAVWTLEDCLARCELFSRTGFDEAEELDRQARVATEERKAALRGADRVFVERLSVVDPGTQVQVRAAYAARPGGPDEDVAEFFAAGWVSAARLDLQAFQDALLIDAMRFQSQINALMRDAEVAEAAARGVSGAAGEAKRAAAAAAWRQVGEKTGSARDVWAEAQAAADRQAAVWREVAQAAADAAGNITWEAIGDAAPQNQLDWVELRGAAEAQSRYWVELLERVRVAVEAWERPGV